MRGFNKILIIRLDRLGDVVLSTPVFKAVRQAYPASRIAVMVKPYAEDIVRGNPYIDEVILYHKDTLHKGLGGTIKFANEMRAKRFDLAIVLHPSNRSNLIPFLAGIPVRLGYDRKMGFLLTARVPHKKDLGLKHEVDYTMDMLRYISIGSSCRDLHMPVDKASEEKVERLFLENGITKDSVVVVIHPAASCWSRIWMPKRFAAVADSLAQKHKAKVILIAAGAEKKYADDVAGLAKSPVINMAGRTSVADMASVLKRCNLLIASDSGPVHIACALGTPVVVLFGRKGRGISPERWGPTGRNCVLIHKDVGCEVCLAHKCDKDLACFRAITVDDVLAACDSLLRH